MYGRGAAREAELRGVPMGKTTRSARQLLEEIERAELQDYPEEAREEAQKLLLSRHLAILDAMRRPGQRRHARRRP